MMADYIFFDRLKFWKVFRPKIWGRFLLAAALVIIILSWGTFPVYGQEPLSIAGITEPVRDVKLSATVAGTISAIFFYEGMDVKENDIILELDKKIETLEAERRWSLWESKAELDAANARVLTLKSLLTATRELFDRTGSVSKEELDKLALDYELALADKRRLEAAEERERIEYEMAKENLRKRSLTSPVQGTIIKLFFEEGETCEENQPLVHVVDTSRGRFICNVEEWIGRTLREGQSVDLRIRTGNKSISKKGTIVFVSPVVDPGSGLLEVKAEFGNEDGKVRLGISGMMLLKIPRD